MNVLHDVFNSLMQMAESRNVEHCIMTYKKHYKRAYFWTLERGCLVFTSLIIYYLSFVSTRTIQPMDLVVTILFFLGTAAFFATSSLVRKVGGMLESNTLAKALKTTNKYVFVFLSYLPGLYFAFQYEEFILRFYLVIHIVSSGYFFYKRLKDFELIPFLAGLGMSFMLGSIGPSIRSFFALLGTGWFPTTCAWFLETVVSTALAVAFLLRLPEKYFPPSMIFGTKILRYIMFIFSWKTFYILMVIVSWRNIGAAAETLIELYFSTPKSDESKPGSGNRKLSESKKGSESKKSSE